MAWTSKVSLSLAEFLLYIVLAPFFAYTAFKHRNPSLSGHVYMFAFMALRLVTDGLAVSKRDQPADANKAGTIINSIGLSPLLLATAGFLDEARYYILNYPCNRAAKKVGLFYELVLHILVVTGVAILAIGRTRAANAASSSDLHKYRGLQYGGVVLLLLAWLNLCGAAIWTALTAHRQQTTAQRRRGAGLLVNEIAASLLFTGVRVIYSLTYTFDSQPQVQPQTATFANYFFLLFLSQLVAVLIIARALLLTRNISAQFSHANLTTPPAVVNMEGGTSEPQY